MAEKIAWVREAAGDRFTQIALSMIVPPLLTAQRRQRAAGLIQERGWEGLSVEEVLEMPAIFIGTEGQIIEQMQQRREEYGFSYYVAPDSSSAAMAKRVSAGRRPAAITVPLPPRVGAGRDRRGAGPSR